MVLITGLSILKAKDDVSSVSKNLDNAVVSLPYDLDILVILILMFLLI